MDKLFKEWLEENDEFLLCYDSLGAFKIDFKSASLFVNDETLLGFLRNDPPLLYQTDVKFIGRNLRPPRISHICITFPIVIRVPYDKRNGKRSKDMMRIWSNSETDLSLLESVYNDFV